MGLLILEALAALLLLLIIVWWTMFHGRSRGELSAEDTPPASNAAQPAEGQGPPP